MNKVRVKILRLKKILSNITNTNYPMTMNFPHIKNSYKRSNESIDEFFMEPAKKKIKTKRSSTVGRPNKNSYVSTDRDNGTVAKHHKNRGVRTQEVGECRPVVTFETR
ncbi:unnamed protein product [Parnassius apollo]|uniref:(apollo) hypothetical protein n=1 Tax=Parnassius apollo TaxID=110799 RepID=A0A8S3WIL4_PARAO|nr:unnamed protein product [Parnassius apollo]